MFSFPVEGVVHGLLEFSVVFFLLGQTSSHSKHTFPLPTLDGRVNDVCLLNDTSHNVLVVYSLLSHLRGAYTVSKGPNRLSAC